MAHPSIPVGPIHFGAGFRLRRFLIVVGWSLLPLLLYSGVRMPSPLHLIAGVVLFIALWPMTARSGEILWEGEQISVRRYFRYVPLASDQVEAAVVTPPVFRRQSLVLRLREPLRFSKYVYCRLSPGTVCAAWSLVYQRKWEPR